MRGYWHSRKLGMGSKGVGDVLRLESALLPAPTRGADSSCQILLVERLAYEGLDHRLAADVQLLGGAVQLGIGFS